MLYLDIEPILSCETHEVVRLPLKGHKNLSELKMYNFGNEYLADEYGNVYRIKRIEGKEFVGTRIRDYQTYDFYRELILTDANKKKKHIQKHRIVAGLFIKNDDPKNKIQVDHIDGNRSNNHVSNLRWCTRSENITYMWANRKRRELEQKQK